MGINLSENERLLAIELADDWSKDAKPVQHQPSDEEKIKARASAFDQAYKAIVKTLTGDGHPTKPQQARY